MQKQLIAILLCMTFCILAKGQVRDTISPADRISKDTFNMQDTSNIPQGKESEKVEKKAPEVYKDSTRLALEKLTRTAVRKSMILPGWGQIQNGRWWKAPLVVGGFVGIYMSYDFAKRNYKLYLKEAQYRAVNPGQGVYENEDLAQYNSQSIIAAKDFYRRNRDLSVLGGLGFYAIQLIDAYVDAKFFRYDISDDFSFNVAPSFEPTPWMLADSRAALGLKVAFRIH